MKHPTNIIVSVRRPRTSFTERFVMPQSRGGMDRLQEKVSECEEMLGVPFVICLDDKTWCIDDPVFLLERMMWSEGEDDVSLGRILEITDEYIYRPWKNGESERVLKLNDGTITFTPDRSNLSELNVLNVETNELVKMEES